MNCEETLLKFCNYLWACWRPLTQMFCTSDDRDKQTTDYNLSAPWVWQSGIAAQMLFTPCAPPDHIVRLR